MRDQEKFYFATVGKVYADGITLVFDGTDAPSEKHYKANTSVTFRAGDRVKIFPTSGTYVVEYIVGDPIYSGSDHEHYDGNNNGVCDYPGCSEPV